MTTLTARTPEDVLAAVPVVLGFHPSDSIVMLTFGGRTPFHARVDLPPPRLGAEVADQVVGSLLEPAVRHGVRRVLLVLYASDARDVVVTAGALGRGFRAAGIEILETLVVDDHRWYPLSPTGAPEGPGSAYDVSAHRFVVASVVDGAVTHRSRADLAASLEPDPGAVARVTAELGRPASAGEAVSTVQAHAEAGTVPDDAELAGLLVALLDRPVRDAAWLLAERETAVRHTRLWTDVVRRAPPALASSPLVLLAVTAWIAGHGALAWCALDRLFEVDPEHSLGLRVAELLAGAVPPSFMETLRTAARSGG